MKKKHLTILSVVLCIAFILVAFTSDVSAESTDITHRAIACECGGGLYNSNATISIQTGNENIPCGSVYSDAPSECIDRLLSYDIYNTYACNKCTKLIQRSKVGTQDRYYCTSGGKFYNPITGQSLPIVDVDICHNHDDYIYENTYNIINTENSIQCEDELDVSLRGVICSCGGNLIPSNNLILSDSYTVLKNTVVCKYTPEWTTRRDEVWRYYFYNTQICNSCGTIFHREKTALYEDWGYCQHGYGGKYPLNDPDPWSAEIS